MYVFKYTTIFNSICYAGARVAQWIARWTSNPKVAGSSPASSRVFFCYCMGSRRSLGYLAFSKPPYAEIG